MTTRVAGLWLSFSIVSCFLPENDLEDIMTLNTVLIPKLKDSKKNFLEMKH